MSDHGLILPEGSIFRLIPKVVEPRQALLFDALAYAADSLDMAYSVIIMLAKSIGDDPKNLTRPLQIQLLNNAWSMVDALHNTREILEALGFTSPTAAEFAKKYESATLLRNAMDHIKDQANNLAMKKKAEPPLLGALSYNYIPQEAIVLGDDGTVSNITNGVAITTSIGRLRKKNIRMELLNPASQRILHQNVSGLQLEAFDYSIELMHAYRDFSDLIDKMDKAVTESVSDQARRLAVEHGIPYEELMGHFAAGLSTFAIWRSAPTGEVIAVDEVGPDSGNDNASAASSEEGTDRGFA